MVSTILFNSGWFRWWDGACSNSSLIWYLLYNLFCFEYLPHVCVVIKTLNLNFVSIMVPLIAWCFMLKVSKFHNKSLILKLQSTKFWFSVIYILKSEHRHMYGKKGCGFVSPGCLQLWVSVYTVLEHWCQKQVSRVGISNYIPQNTVGCNYLSMP